MCSPNPPPLPLLPLLSLMQRAYSHITRGSDPNPANDDYHGPFKAPSTRLFAEFCNELIKGYGVDGMVHKGRAVDLSRCGDSGLFRVQVDDGGQVRYPQPPNVADVRIHSRMQR
jgi:hypothetical protein